MQILAAIVIDGAFITVLVLLGTFIYGIGSLALSLVPSEQSTDITEKSPKSLHNQTLNNKQKEDGCRCPPNYNQSTIN
jgi:Na+-transporting methylmalonyl-CoA/oxaloacetate decarboxylase gamma subunit